MELSGGMPWVGPHEACLDHIFYSKVSMYWASCELPVLGKNVSGDDPFVGKEMKGVFGRPATSDAVQGMRAAFPGDNFTLFLIQY